MSKPKFIKPLLIGCACAIPVGLVVGLSVNWEHRQFLSSVGSSGTKPFIEAFGKEYSKANPKIDVQVESGGTTFAVEQLAKGFTHVGNASNNPYRTVNKSNSGIKEKWENKKTFTLGFEGLVILYKMPEGLSAKAQEVFDIVISHDNIRHLFAVFSCYNDLKNEHWKDEYGSIYHFMTKESIAAIEQLPTAKEDLKLCKDTQITPFVRSGGNVNANSSIAFSYYSNLGDIDNDVTTEQKAAYTDGVYGKDRDHHETEESNARAWQLFNNKHIPGSMVYLTTGFVKNKDNQKEIKRLGYKLAGYLPYDEETGESADEPVYLENDGDLEKICKTGGYNWYRPINCMIDTTVEMSRNFIDFIYTCDSYKDLMLKNGAKPLTANQLASMSYDQDYSHIFDAESSDLELEKIRTSKWGQITYGAEEIWD